MFHVVLHWNREQKIAQKIQPKQRTRHIFYHNLFECEP